MKLLVFAHVPPPHHGQAVMVELMLRGLGEKPQIAQISQIDVNGGRGSARAEEWPQKGAESTEENEEQSTTNDERRTKNDQRDSITVFHIDARFSTGIEDIGRGGVRKVLLLAKYALHLVWFALFKRPDVVYFVPSPGKKVAIVRDWVLIGLCRLLGLPRIFHWHAGGLSGWVEESASGWQKSLSMWVYGNAALSIIPVESERSNAAYFHPQRIVKIPNGIPDPCPDFSSSVLPLRVNRLEARRTGEAHIIRVLFMGHCTEDKGLFDAMDAVQLANRKSRDSGQPWVFSLQVFGKFMNDADRARFGDLSRGPQWAGDPVGTSLLYYSEFVGGKDKARVFCESDVLCFPSYYAAEVIPTVILDALAYGLPVIGTRWRGIPELLPQGGLEPSEIKRPDQVAARLLEVPGVENFSEYRARFETQFSLGAFIDSIREAVLLKEE